MAIGLLDQTEQLVSGFVKHCGFIGELSLNGKIRGVKGVLPMVIEAKKQGIDHVIVPLENLEEAMLVKGVHVFGFEDFRSMMKLVNGKGSYDLPTFKEAEEIPTDIYSLDFKDVKGQQNIIRNTVVAAAGTTQFRGVASVRRRLLDPHNLKI